MSLIKNDNDFDFSNFIGQDKEENKILEDNDEEIYIVQKLIDSGKFGRVYKSLNYDNICAIKIINKNNFVKDIDLDNLLQECTIHSKLNHKNILKFITMFHSLNNVFIVLEFCEVSLSNIYKNIDIIQSKIILKNITEGLLYLYNNLIIHRDIKLENILICNNTCKICDFGLSVKLESINEKRTDLVGTPYYISPQIAEKIPYTIATDIWSLGVLFYKLIFKHTPFKSKSYNILINKIIKMDFSIKPIMCEDKICIKLMYGMLNKGEEKRITLEEILNILEENDI